MFDRAALDRLIDALDAMPESAHEPVRRCRGERCRHAVLSDYNEGEWCWPCQEAGLDQRLRELDRRDDAIARGTHSGPRPFLPGPHELRIAELLAQRPHSGVVLAAELRRMGCNSGNGPLVKLKVRRLVTRQLLREPKIKSLWALTDEGRAWWESRPESRRPAAGTPAAVPAPAAAAPAAE